MSVTCSKFLTTAEYIPRLRDRFCLEQRLAEDAAQRGWQREVERHNATASRLAALLGEPESEGDWVRIGGPAFTPEACFGGHNRPRTQLINYSGARCPHRVGHARVVGPG